MRIHVKSFLSVVALIAIMAVGVTASAEEQAWTPLDIPMIGDMEPLAVGEDAPSFEVKDVDGQPYVFAGTDPGTKMVLFWSMFCEPCKAEMPLIQSMADKYRDAGLKVISVALDGISLSRNIKKFTEQFGYTFTVLLDEETEDESLVVADEFLVSGTPTIYLINEQGKITFYKVGPVGEAELEKAIQNAIGK
jgi:thiol-disulfide isomerase/thioredoxin